MASKLIFTNDKNNELIIKADDMNIQEILQYSLINKYPLALVINNLGNNLIHLTINNLKKIKSEFNKLNFIKFLIQNNVNPDQPNKENQTPLHLACQFQYLDIVNLLLKFNANPNYKDNNGLTPLHYLYTGDIKLFKEKEIKEFIIPNKSTTIIDKNKLFEIKNELWEIIKNEKYSYFFNSLNKTIFESIKNDDNIKIDIETNIEKFKSMSISNNTILINDIYKNLKSSISSKSKIKWNNFSIDEDIDLHDKTIE